ncbi:MAG: hypothetical protein IT285_08660 [Bdellovibrionales bacterium]|nr:hypothetical protein [Bdellovibrionales bacterium]
MGLVSGLFFAGATASFHERWAAGLELVRMDLSFDTVAISGTGIGVHVDHHFTGSALGSGWVASAWAFRLPAAFEDRPPGEDPLVGELTAWGGLVSAGYQFAWGPVRLRPALVLAYLELPSTVRVTDGPLTGEVDVDEVRGWLPAAQLVVGVSF